MHIFVQDLRADVPDARHRWIACTSRTTKLCCLVGSRDLPIPRRPSWKGGAAKQGPKPKDNTNCDISLWHVSCYLLHGVSGCLTSDLRMSEVWPKLYAACWYKLYSMNDASHGTLFLCKAATTPVKNMDNHFQYNVWGGDTTCWLTAAFSAGYENTVMSNSNVICSTTWQT